MKKRIYLILILIFFIGILCISTKVLGYDTTKKLYQQITINKDGSITVKEAALLDGTYNGREREIYFKNTSATKFTGIYSNFSGNTDIYNGSSIKDIKIYDISQKNFQTIKDINKIEKEYKEVKSASKGKYGVYTIENHSYGVDFRIYCPSKEQKVFGMEYTITDAVVVHNDIAELYWNTIGKSYRENINDFQVMVYLPQSDNDLRVWTHGPLSGQNKIIDSKTVYFNDSNIEPYEPETIRIMFNKDIVPNATKKSGVDGKNYILQYEQKMADSANYEREQGKLDEINRASQSIENLEEYQTIYLYRYALQSIANIEDETQKQEFLERIEKQKYNVNENWKESIEYDINLMKKYSNMLNKSNIENLQTKIEEGFDDEAKTIYNQEIQNLKELLDVKYAQIRKNTFAVVTFIFMISTIIVIYIVIQLVKEKNKFQGNYYREFPSTISPYVLEYLMKKDVTDLSISAVILDLIARNIIKIEQLPNDKKNVKFIFIDEQCKVTKAENTILQMMFDIAGDKNVCTLDQIKKLGKKESSAERLINKIENFKKEAKKEAKEKNYFKNNKIGIFMKIAIIVAYIITLCSLGALFIGLNGVKNEIIYFVIVNIIFIIYFMIIWKDKQRTEEGKIEYSKWLAHKRFLKDFGNMDEKDLPEIVLWEKYLVTATILGQADKIEKKMKINIENFNDTTYVRNLLLSTTINSGIRQSINTAHSSIASSSSYSSGGGFGGGSSGSGGRRRPEVAVEAVSNTI